jgi:DNA-directed RNA polymerase omega subunit
MTNHQSHAISRFEFVVTAGARARQLLAGCTPRVDAGDHKKTTIARREVTTGAVQRQDQSAPAAEAPAVDEPGLD